MASKAFKVKTKKGVKWRIQICVNGHRQSKTMDTKNEVVQWSLDMEGALSKGAGVVTGRTFGDAMKRYAKEVSPSKKGARWEIIRLKKLLKDPIANIMTTDFGRSDIEEFRDRMLKTLAPNSVIRELTLLKSVARQCSSEWSWMAEYPFEELKNPEAGKGREITYTDEQIAKITQFSGLGARNGKVTTKMQEVGILFLLGIETGMRLGEMCKMTRSDISLTDQTVQLTKTKNGDDRTVALSSKAIEVLSWLPEKQSGRLFSVVSGTASTSFRRIRKRAGIEGLTFHDTRHTATTRMSEFLEPFELARQVGHRNVNQTLKYFNKPAKQIAKKLG